MEHWFYDDLERDFVGTVTRVLRFIGAPPVPGEGEQIPRVNTSGKPLFADDLARLRTLLPGPHPAWLAAA